MKTLKPLPAWLPIVALLFAACGGGESAQTEQDSLARNLTLAPGDTTQAMTDMPEAAPPEPAPQRPVAQRPPPRQRPAPTPPSEPAPSRPANLMLSNGTQFDASFGDTITSRTNKAGETVVATVSANVADASGRTVIPAGSRLHGVIRLIEPAENPGDTGKVSIDFTGVEVNGTRYDLAGTMVQAAFVMKGRGVTGGEVAKVGAGAAAGAVAGQILGKKTKSTVIGAVVGAAAGAGVAAATRDIDIVIPAGTTVRVQLSQEFSRPVAT